MKSQIVPTSKGYWVGKVSSVCGILSKVRCYTAVEISCYSSSTGVHLVSPGDRASVLCAVLHFQRPPQGFSCLLDRRDVEMHKEQRGVSLWV